MNLLQESCSYPWHLLNYEAIESVLNWFVMSTEPSVILKIPTEHEAIDSSVLTLLQTASSVVSLSDEQANYQQQSQVQAKRILYVRSITRLLKGCGAKLQKLLATKQGICSLKNSILIIYFYWIF